MPERKPIRSRFAGSFIDQLGTRRKARPAVPPEVASLIDDLDLLLNTRVRPHDDLQAYPHLRRSVFNLGVSDFTGVAFATPEDAATSIALAIKEALKSFEPRLTAVSVIPQVRDGVLTFEIHGRMPSSDQAADAIILEATLEGASSRLAVTR
jgi:type VI secretion system lysozyme-like protein